MTNASLTLSQQKKHDWSVIGLVGIGHAGSHFSHLLLPLMFPFFAEVFHLGFTQLGLTVTVFFVVSGVGQALSGFAVDRLGPILVLFISLALLSLGCVVASAANGLNELLVAAMLLGLGDCSFHTIGGWLIGVQHYSSWPFLPYFGWLEVILTYLEPLIHQIKKLDP